ncbi:MAG: hypothetical protein NTZ60_00045 [Campylobacterales bacterium]|nr:hypothetical protein [Campylobacterales bacterium]
MDASGMDTQTASKYLYDVVGANSDYRDWSSIMASSDVLSAAKTATHAMYFSNNAPDRTSELKSKGYNPVDANTIVAQSGNIAAVQTDGTLSYKIIRNDGYAVGNSIGTNDAKGLLDVMDTYGIDKSALTALADQLDAKGVKYKPYELYPGTGSDAGINLRDLASGGLGTAYDWTKDANAAIKDSFLVGTGVAGQASQAVADAQVLANRLNIVKHSDVTTEKGIDLSSLTPQISGANTLNYVVGNSGVASWYNTTDQAVKAQQLIGGEVIDLSKNTNGAGTQASTLAETNAQVATLSQQLADLSLKLTSGDTTSTTNFMNSYKQLQTLIAQMETLQTSS